ncbi:MAG: molybdopterin-synthase adenylyltransferase MoeB [Verrucomicrobia bacterium]|nr:molybdopterin-synthase adenylyltransferase MoeB [Verrucomicrobiota bacterium]
MPFPSLIDAGRLAAVQLGASDLERYARHLTLPEVGPEGQRRLRAASVLCVGLGGLGSPATMYLAAAGIGKLGLVDFDRVDRSNLQRQILHGESDLGRSKLDSAEKTLREINPGVETVRHETRLTGANAMEIARDYDLILDGTDNFATRYLSNDLAVLSGKPNVYGSIFRFEGQCSVFAPHLGGPCYRCLFPVPPEPGTVPGCAEGGVLGVLPGIVGTLQALEAIKLILGIGEPLVGRLVHFDALGFRFREIKLRRDPECPVCGENPTVRALIDYEQFCGGGPPAGPALGVAELRERLAAGDIHLIDVREPFEREICRIPGAVPIPLGELPDRMAEVPRDRDVAIHCKSGRRSAEAVKLLQKAGWTRVRNVEGGILAWAEIDPGVQPY